MWAVVSPQAKVAEELPSYVLFVGAEELSEWYDMAEDEELEEWGCEAENEELDEEDEEEDKAREPFITSKGVPTP